MMLLRIHLSFPSSSRVTGSRRVLQGEKQAGWDRHTASPCPLRSWLCYILLGARQQSKLLFKGEGCMMEIRNKVEKLFYLVEDSSEKPAWKENTSLHKYNKSPTALRTVFM